MKSQRFLIELKWQVLKIIFSLNLHLHLIDMLKIAGSFFLTFSLLSGFDCVSVAVSDVDLEVDGSDLVLLSPTGLGSKAV